MEDNTTRQTESQKEEKYESGDEVAKNIATNLPVSGMCFSKEDMRKSFTAGEIKTGNKELNFRYNQKLAVNDFDKWFEKHYH